MKAALQGAHMLRPPGLLVLHAQVAPLARRAMLTDHCECPHNTQHPNQVAVVLLRMMKMRCWRSWQI